MRKISVPVAVIFGAILASVAQVIYFYPLLPDRVATHFGPDGRPDSWMSKDACIAMNLIFVTVFAAFLSGTTTLIARLPNSAINLPNKEFWLAPERREQSLAWVRDQMQWMNAATLAFLVAVFQEVYRVNLLPDPRLGSSFFWTLLAFLAFTAVWSAGLVRRFRLPSE
jgi:Predicted membrane protein